MNEQMITICSVIAITIIVMLSCTVWHLLWKVKVIEKVSSKRLADTKKLIKQVEDLVDIKNYIEKELAKLKNIINNHPEAQLEWLNSKVPGHDIKTLKKIKFIGQQDKGVIK